MISSIFLTLAVTLGSGAAHAEPFAQSQGAGFGAIRAQARSPWAAAPSVGRAGPVTSVDALPPDPHRCRDVNGLAGAAEQGCRRLVRTLLGSGADPSERSHWTYGCWTPVSRAASRGHLGILQDLLEAGGDPNRCEALFSAAYNGEPETAMALLARGAVADTTTALHAAMKGLDDVVAAILENPSFEIRVDYEDPAEAAGVANANYWKSGWYFIHYIARMPANRAHKARAMELALRRGNSVNMRIGERANSNPEHVGKTALDLARETASPETVEVLLRHGAVSGFAG